MCVKFQANRRLLLSLICIPFRIINVIDHFIELNWLLFLSIVWIELIPDSNDDQEADSIQLLNVLKTKANNLIKQIYIQIGALIKSMI